MNGNSDSFAGMEQDILKEIANIGSGHAATALSTLLDRPITQSVPNVRLVPLAEMSNALGGAEKVVVAGMVEISGDLSGYLMMVLSFEQAEKIIAMVQGESPKTSQTAGYHFTEMEESVLSETVNIMGGSYLMAISGMTGMAMTSSIPYLCVDMVGAVLSVVLAEVGQAGNFGLLFQSELFNEQECISGNLFLVPEAESCNKIMESLGFN